MSDFICHTVKKLLDLIDLVKLAFKVFIAGYSSLYLWTNLAPLVRCDSSGDFFHYDLWDHRLFPPCVSCGNYWVYCFLVACNGEGFTCKSKIQKNAFPDLQSSLIACSSLLFGTLFCRF